MRSPRGCACRARGRGRCRRQRQSRPLVLRDRLESRPRQGAITAVFIATAIPELRRRIVLYVSLRVSACCDHAASGRYSVLQESLTPLTASARTRGIGKCGIGAAANVPSTATLRPTGHMADGIFAAQRAL